MKTLITLLMIFSVCMLKGARIKEESVNSNFHCSLQDSSQQTYQLQVSDITIRTTQSEFSLRPNELAWELNHENFHLEVGHDGSANGILIESSGQETALEGSCKVVNRS